MWMKDNHLAVSEKILALWGAPQTVVEKRVEAAKARLSSVKGGHERAGSVTIVDDCRTAESRSLVQPAAGGVLPGEAASAERANGLSHLANGPGALEELLPACSPQAMCVVSNIGQALNQAARKLPESAATMAPQPLELPAPSVASGLNLARAAVPDNSVLSTAPGRPLAVDQGGLAGMRVPEAKESLLTLESSEPAAKMSCVVCLDKHNSHTCVPCGHKCVCDSPICAAAMRGRCPICREPVHTLLSRVHEAGYAEAASSQLQDKTTSVDNVSMSTATQPGGPRRPAALRPTATDVTEALSGVAGCARLQAAPSSATVPRCEGSETHDAVEYFKAVPKRPQVAYSAPGSGGGGEDGTSGRDPPPRTDSPVREDAQLVRMRAHRRMAPALGLRPLSWADADLMAAVQQPAARGAGPITEGASGASGVERLSPAEPQGACGREGDESESQFACHDYWQGPPRGLAPEYMAGTALVFAALAMKATLPDATYCEQFAKAARLFAGVRDGAGHDFVSLHHLFKALLFPPAGIPQDKKWMPKARLWRFILLQQPDGHFKPTKGLATALFAQTAGSNDGEEGDALQFEAEAMRSSMPPQLSERFQEATGRHGHEGSPPRGHGTEARKHQGAAEKHGDGHGGLGLPGIEAVNVDILWATMLSVAVMETLEFCWLADEEELVTIVDKADEWVEEQVARIFGEEGTEERRKASLYSQDDVKRAEEAAQAKEAARRAFGRNSSLATSQRAPSEAGGAPAPGSTGGPLRALGTLLNQLVREADDEAEALKGAQADPLVELRRLARRVVAQWSKLQLKRVKRLRAIERSSLHGIGTAVQKASGDVVMSLLVKHETFSNFLSPVPLELPRWQNFMSLVTMIMSVLVVDVWFYYSKSLNCCIEIRLLLGCPASYLLPCREFVGNCGDTKDQFATLQDSGIPDDYECHQFPDETAFKDKIVVGLICTAVAIPFTYLIGEVFAKGNEPEFPELQLSWPMKWWTRGLFLKMKERWDWRHSRPWKFHVTTARQAHEGQGKIFFELFNEHVFEPIWDTICCEEESGSESGSESSSESGSEAGSNKGSKKGSGKHSGKHEGGGPTLWEYLCSGPFARRILPVLEGKVAESHEKPGHSTAEHAPGTSPMEAGHERGHGCSAASSNHADGPSPARPLLGTAGLLQKARDCSSQRSGAHGAHTVVAEADGEAEADWHGLSRAEWRREMRKVDKALEESFAVMETHKSMKRMGLVLIYMAWAIMVWIIFVYGALLVEVSWPRRKRFRAVSPSWPRTSYDAPTDCGADDCNPSCPTCAAAPREQQRPAHPPALLPRGVALPHRQAHLQPLRPEDGGGFRQKLGCRPRNRAGAILSGFSE